MRSKAANGLAGFRAAQRRPAAVPAKPASRSAAMTVFRTAAMTCGDAPGRSRLASSFMVTSRGAGPRYPSGRERRARVPPAGQGWSSASGWQAHKLTRPGEFLISDPEHGTPERNRAYLLDDERRDQHSARYGHRQPTPPAAVPDAPRTAPEPPHDAPDGPPRGDGRNDRPRPETALWDALVDAGPEGVSVGELGAACGM